MNQELVKQISINTQCCCHTCTVKHFSNVSLCCCRLVCLFLKRGADYNAKDIDDKDPIGIAIDAANADIVTL